MGLEKLEDIIMDDDGRVKPIASFALTNLVVIPPVLHTAVKWGFYHGAFPRFNVFQVMNGANGEPWYYSVTRLGEAFDGSYVFLSVLGLTAVDVIMWAYTERRKNLSQQSKGKARWNSIRKYNPVFVYPKGSKVPIEPVEKMGPVTPAEEKAAREPGNMILGKLKRGDLCFDMHQKGGTNVYCNSLVLGSTGTGKSFGFVKPNVMQFNTSLVITDPAGDLTRECGPALVANGYNVKVFNVAEMKYSCRYNPFKYVRNQQDVMTMINVFMENTDDAESGKGDQFFTKAEQCLYLAMAFYIFEVYKDQPEKQNFNTMFEMYQEANASEDSKRENEINEFDKKFIELARKNPNSPALKYYRIFKKGTGKTLKSILISAGVRLAFLAIPEVADLLSGDDLELETLGDRRQAIFMIIKAEDSTYNFITAMLFTQMFETQYYIAGNLNPNSLLLRKGKTVALKSKKFDSEHQKKEALKELEEKRERYKKAVIEEDDPKAEEFNVPDDEGFCPYPKTHLVVYEGEKRTVLKSFLGRKEAELFLDCIKYGTIEQGTKLLPCHIRFILDEFANIGKIPDFDKKLATFRKYGISSDIIIQSLAQIRKMYEDNIGLIVGNCNIIICLGTTDKEDSEFFSELLGQKTVETISKSFDNKGVFTGIGGGGNISVDAENLMRPEDVRNMAPDECLVFISTQSPFKAKKYPATAHPNYKYLYDDHKDSNNPDEWVPPFEYQRIFKVKHVELAGIRPEDLDPSFAANAQGQIETKPNFAATKPVPKRNAPQRYSAVDDGKNSSMRKDIKLKQEADRRALEERLVSNMNTTIIDGNKCVPLEDVKNVIQTPEFKEKLEKFANDSNNVDENGVLDGAGFIAEGFDDFF